MYCLGYRSDVLAAAERFAGGLPKTRKPPRDARPSKRKVTDEEDAPRVRKRRASGEEFTIAEDPKQLEEPPNIPEDKSKNASIDLLPFPPRLSSATLNKLNAFKHKRETSARPLAPATNQSLKQTNSLHDEDRQQLKTYRIGQNLLSSTKETHTAIPHHEPDAFEVAHLDGYVVEKNRRVLKEFKNNNTEPLLSPVIKAMIKPAPTFNSVAKDIHKTTIPDSETGSCEVDFEEDDQIFEQFIANDAAENFPIQRTPTFANISDDPFSTPSPLATRMTPPALVFDTLRELTEEEKPSKFCTPPTPPIKPFFRAVLPSPALTSSPIPNLTAKVRIPTCFRLGEALRLLSPTSTAAYRAIEIYAIVISSSRKDAVQLFQFADLYFPQRPPYLAGTYSGWMGSELFDHDSAAFLGEANTDMEAEAGDRDVRMCRAIVQQIQCLSQLSAQAGMATLATCISSPLSRTHVDVKERPDAGHSNDSGALVEVLNIWRCDWDDIAYVKGIVREDEASATSPKKVQPTVKKMHHGFR